jgi:PE family
VRAAASVARLFSDYGQEYQKLARRAAAFHDEFVQRLTPSAKAYASAEAVNAALLQQPLNEFLSYAPLSLFAPIGLLGTQYFLAAIIIVYEFLGYPAVPNAFPL